MKDLDNLRNLFSEDDNIVFKALTEKKEWINKEYYLVFSMANSQELEDLMSFKLRFKKLYIDPSLCQGNYKEITDCFSSFRVLYLYNDIIDTLTEDEFVVRINFKKLLDKDYVNLFANFYHCLNKNEILIKEELLILDSLKRAMNNQLGDNVIIMDDKNLDSSCFQTRCYDQIIYNDHLHQGYIPYLNIISSKMNVEIRKI